MKKLLTTLTATATLACLPAAFGADITGKVTLNGNPPAEKPIPLDANCTKVQPKAITTRHYVVGQDKGLGNVFVWVKAGVSKKYDPPAKPAILDQTGCEYQPYMQGMQTGQTLKIVNSDPFLHNVNCQPTNNPGFNMAQITKGQTSDKTFGKQEVFVRFKCDVHPWMFAYIGVVDHPFFAVTDKDGNFKLAGLPAGKYTIEARHLKAGVTTQEITVAEGDQKTVTFALSVPGAP
jgi:hypothetical protein